MSHFCTSHQGPECKPHLHTQLQEFSCLGLGPAVGVTQKEEIFEKELQELGTWPNTGYDQQSWSSDELTQEYPCSSSRISLLLPWHLSYQYNLSSQLPAHECLDPGLSLLKGSGTASWQGGRGRFPALLTCGCTSRLQTLRCTTQPTTHHSPEHFSPLTAPPQHLSQFHFLEIIQLWFGYKVKRLLFGFFFFFRKPLIDIKR